MDERASPSSGVCLPITPLSSAPGGLCVHWDPWLLTPFGLGCKNLLRGGGGSEGREPGMLPGSGPAVLLHWWAASPTALLFFSASSGLCVHPAVLLGPWGSLFSPQPCQSPLTDLAKAALLGPLAPAGTHGNASVVCQLTPSLSLEVMAGDGKVVLLQRSGRLWGS